MLGQDGLEGLPLCVCGWMYQNKNGDMMDKYSVDNETKYLEGMEYSTEVLSRPREGWPFDY